MILLFLPFKCDIQRFHCLTFTLEIKITTCSRMIEPSIWLSEKEACELLRVDRKSLESLRESGYLKLGPHWRSSNDPKQLPWKPKAFYCISGCKEVIEYWQNNIASFDQIAA